VVAFARESENKRSSPGAERSRFALSQLTGEKFELLLSAVHASETRGAQRRQQINVIILKYVTPVFHIALNRFNKECIPFKNRDKVKSKHEFVRVECFSNSTQDSELIYKDFHAFVPLKAKVEDRCSDIPTSNDQVIIISTLVFLIFYSKLMQLD